MLSARARTRRLEDALAAGLADAQAVVQRGVRAVEQLVVEADALDPLAADELQLAGDRAQQRRRWTSSSSCGTLPSRALQVRRKSEKK